MSKKFSKNNSKEKKEKEITWEMFIKSIRILKGYIRPYKKKLILISFFAILGAIMQAFVPYMSGNIIDKIISLSQGSEVVFTLLIFLGIWFILKFGYNIISWKTGFHNEKLSQRLFVDYMVKGIGELFEKSVSFHKDKKRGQVWEKVMRASRAIMNLSSRFSLDIIPALLTFIAAIIITFTINI